VEGRVGLSVAMEFNLGGRVLEGDGAVKDGKCDNERFCEKEDS